MDIATELMINEEIRDREVRLIDENGEQLGVMGIQQALALAEEAGKRVHNGWSVRVRRGGGRTSG